MLVFIFTEEKIQRHLFSSCLTALPTFQRELFKMFYLIKNRTDFIHSISPGGNAPREGVWRVFVKECLDLWDGGTRAVTGKEECGNNRCAQSFTFQP